MLRNVVPVSDQTAFLTELYLHYVDKRVVAMGKVNYLSESPACTLQRTLVIPNSQNKEDVTFTHKHVTVLSVNGNDWVEEGHWVA